MFSAGFRIVGDPDSNSKELLLDWEVEVRSTEGSDLASNSKKLWETDLGVVRSMISGFTWNWKRSVGKVKSKSKRSSEVLKGSGMAVEEAELEVREQRESERD